jgi:hypothetical protein
MPSRILEGMHHSAKANSEQKWTKTSFLGDGGPGRGRHPAWHFRLGKRSGQYFKVGWCESAPDGCNFGSLKQINAGPRNVGYAEALLVNGPR